MIGVWAYPLERANQGRAREWENACGIVSNIETCFRRLYLITLSICNTDLLPIGLDLTPMPMRHAKDLGTVLALQSHITSDSHFEGFHFVPATRGRNRMFVGFNLMYGKK